MASILLSPNFGSEEFDCHDGTPVPAALLPGLTHLVQNVLQPVRDQWCDPLIVVSGFRSFAWNRGVGGALGSTHLDATGADIRPVFRRDVPRLLALVLAMIHQGQLPDLGGLGDYPNWLHLDTRRSPDGHLRRWRGTRIGSEP